MSVTSQLERPRETSLEIGDNKTITIYGMNTQLITDGISFETLARDYYGDPSKAPIIATVNGASSIRDLKSKGEKNVLIPILKKQNSNIDNKIIGLSNQRDNYGIDIALDENGNILLNADGSDFKFTNSRANVSQAVLMRLKENVNKRVMHQYYGIRTTIPDSESAGSAYILSSIIQTLKQEPRIKELLSVSFSGKGDVLNIAVDYKDLGGQAQSVKGSV